MYLPFARRKYGVRGLTRVVSPDTDLVIEGYRRSGNTFAVMAFESGQGGGLELAHHLHAPAQIKAAARWGVPSLLVIRPPEQTVISEVIFQPGITLRQSLRSYIRFHRSLLPYRNGIVIATFHDVTSNFGDVIERLNTRYGTSFAPFEHTEKNVSRCFEAIEARHRTRFGRVVEERIARPSVARDRSKRELMAAYRQASLRGLRVRAEYLYSSLARDSGGRAPILSES